jgi:hypothetical protein
LQINGAINDAFMETQMRGRPPKKKSAELEFIDAPADPPATAQQVHRIVTTFQKNVPIEEALAEDDDSTLEDEEPETEEEGPLDPIQQMLADLNVGEHSHSWTMIVERLPNYEKDGRYDVMAKRINCGTRPVTPDFVEDIRREFARPYKPNHFRLTIKRDGKIYAHWPEALSLEPPPYDEIAAYEAKAQAAAPPAITINNPGQPQSFKQVLDQFKQLAELRAVLFPDLAQQTQQQQSAPAQAQQLTTEAALLHLVSADESLMDKVTSGLSRLIRRAEDGAREIGLMDIAFEAIKNNTLPQLVREFRAMMVEGAQLNGQAQMVQTPMPTHHNAQPAALASQNTDGQRPAVGRTPNQATQEAMPVHPAQPGQVAIPPEIQILNFAVTACAQQAPIAGAVAWVNGFEDRNPSVANFIEMFLAITPDEALQWLTMAIPQAQPIATAPHAKQWIADLQTGLRGEDDGSNNPA